MPTFQGLPAELRQRILEFNVPTCLDVGKPLPSSLLYLHLVSKQTHRDMVEIIKAFPPIHHVCFPTFIKDLTTKTIKVDGKERKLRSKRVCLDVFHECTEERLRWTCWCQGEFKCTHPELVAAWADAVHDLPSNLEAVSLDITPAPAKKRDAHRVITNSFVHNKLTQQFLAGHIHDVSDLIKKIDSHFGGRVPIYLTGRLSERSNFFITGLQIWSELDLEFIGTIITSARGRFAKVSGAVERIAPGQKVNQFAKVGKVYPLLWLREITWSHDTKYTYAKVTDAGHEEEAIQDLRTLAEFKMDEKAVEKLSLTPVDSTRRALQHRFAEDMGLKSASENEGDKRHVLISR